MTAEEIALLDRAILLKEKSDKLTDEFFALEKSPKMLSTSAEDCDDIYQAWLEYKWHRDEVIAEIAALDDERELIHKQLQ